MLRSILNTIYYNFRIFPFKDALKLPLFIGGTTKIKGIRKGCICIKGKIQRGMLSIGRSFGSYGCYRGITSILDFGPQGMLIVNGRTAICTEFKISINGTLNIGENFDANNGLNCICKYSITFGKNCLLGWDVTVIDSDGHQIYIDGVQSSEKKPIKIGDNVWLGAKTTILKGTQISNNSIIGLGTVVSGKYENNSIILGYKGKMIKKNNLKWKK